MLDRQKPDVWLRGASIETGGGREGGKNVSVNGILQPNACENLIVSTYIVKDCNLYCCRSERA
jgi:hypothetical protein